MLSASPKAGVFREIPSKSEVEAGEIMRIDNRDDYIDLVAQAVIDRIEEKDRVSSLVDAVVRRVIELQKEASEAQASEIKENAGGKDEEDS